MGREESHKQPSSSGSCQNLLLMIHVSHTVANGEAAGGDLSAAGWHWLVTLWQSFGGGGGGGGLPRVSRSRNPKQHAKQCSTCMLGLLSAVQAKPKLRTRNLAQTEHGNWGPA